MTITDCRPEVRAFACLMEERLRANDHKYGWKGMPPLSLYLRLQEESAELLRAVLNATAELKSERGPRRAVAHEAGDLANFAMMIADVCGALQAVKP